MDVLCILRKAAQIDQNQCKKISIKIYDGRMKDLDNRESNDDSCKTQKYSEIIKSLKVKDKKLMNKFIMLNL